MLATTQLFYSGWKSDFSFVKLCFLYVQSNATHPLLGSSKTSLSILRMESKKLSRRDKSRTMGFSPALRFLTLCYDNIIGEPD